MDESDGACEARAAIARLALFYERLDPRALARIGELYAPDAHFRDPFNDVVGVAAIQGIFEHMFATVESPRFIVTTSIVQGDQAMLAWDFHLSLRARAIVIRGVSHLRLDATGRVAVHRDYWDAAEELYARLPVVGVLMRLLRRRLAAPQLESGQRL